MRILLVEDDEILSNGISFMLRQSGYAVDEVKNGEDADFAAASVEYDTMILDLGLPKLDGLEVLKRVRERGSLMPILILTARDTLEDRVSGLNNGADDYLTKPFELQELEARIRALIRRHNSSGNTPEITYGSIRFDTIARRVYVKNIPLELSAKEIGVLEVLLRMQNRVVSKEQLIEHLYNWDEFVGINAVEVYIHRIRKKLEGTGFYLRTIRGLGYLLESIPVCP